MEHYPVGYVASQSSVSIMIPGVEDKYAEFGTLGRQGNILMSWILGLRLVMSLMRSLSVTTYIGSE